MNCAWKWKAEGCTWCRLKTESGSLIWVKFKITTLKRLLTNIKVHWKIFKSWRLSWKKNVDLASIQAPRWNKEKTFSARHWGLKDKETELRTSQEIKSFTRFSIFFKKKSNCRKSSTKRFRSFKKSSSRLMRNISKKSKSIWNQELFLHSS